MTVHPFMRTTAMLVTGAILAVSHPARAGKDNAASSCLNVVQNQPANDCYVLTPPISATPLVIDGQDTGGTEWAGVPAKTPAGPMTGSHTIQARHVKTGTSDSLIVFGTIVDGTSAQDDFVQIVFDPLHDDHVPTTTAADDDVMFKIFRIPDAGVHTPKRITKAGEATWTPATGAVAVTSSASGWSFELQVDAGELLISQLASAIGFGVQLNDFDTGDAAVWPLNFSAPSVITIPFTNVALFKNRLPIDYELSLDYSGSMTATDGTAPPVNRWARAVRAADMFVAIAGLFRDTDYFDDRVGGSRYAWNCGDNTSAGDKTERFGGGSGSPPLIEFPSDFTLPDLFSPHLSPDPPGNNCTPIKRGLAFALDQFVPSTSATDRERIVVLLSDGFHNMPSGDVPFDPATAFTLDQRTTHKVRTVSMGADGTAGTTLLAQIAAAFNSTGAFEAKYNQLAAAQNLLDAYLETLQQPLHVNRILDGAPGSPNGSYLPGTVDRLVFIGAWNTPASAAALTIQRDGAAVSGSAIPPDTNIGFSALVVEHPQAGGTWTFAGSTPDIRYVLADLRVYAEFFTEPRIYNTGEPILLQVRLREAGKPVLGAEVAVETAIPGQGLGNFLATTDAECQTTPPTFPNLTQRANAVAVLARPVAGAGSASAAATTGTPDPRPGRYGLAQQLFDRCKKSDDKNNLPGTAMFDDGTHGDLVAGDGVYSLAFPTTLEGSYNFRFNVRGTESTGVKFTRTSLLSQYVQVAPAQGTTQTTVQVGPVVNGLQTAFVLFIPRDPLGNYVGPGFHTNYHVTVSGGTTIGGVTDLGRGVYGQQIGYPVRTQTPPVIIQSDNPPVKIVVGGKVGGKVNLVEWIKQHCCVVLVILVVLLVLVIAVLLRRRP